MSVQTPPIDSSTGSHFSPPDTALLKQNPVANSTEQEEKSCDQSIKIQSLVANVKDLFPQLGTGFLAKCLPYFDNNPETVINALLEDNLPPHLANLDRTMDQ